MANHWLREVRYATAARAGINFYSKCLCWWMYHVLGYTNFVETVASGSYDPTNPATEPNLIYATAVGSINVTGADKNFRDSTNSPFLVGHVNYWILLVDPTNEENSGWYKITAYVDASNVTIDYRSGAAEYPVQNVSNNMDYYMMAEDNNCPSTLTDEWQLRTPHVDAWEIKFILQGNYYLRTEVALDTFAVGNKILKHADPDWKHFGQSNRSTVTDIYYYAEGSDDGAHLNIYMMTTAGTSGTSAATISKMSPFDTSPAHSADELWVLAGGDSVPGWDAEQFMPNNDFNNRWTGYVWRELDASVNRCFPLEWSYADSTVGFTRWGSSESNARTSKIDIKPNITFVIDHANSQDKYEIMGGYPGLSSCRANMPKMQTIDDAGTKDKLQIVRGFVIPWPNVTPQFAPA